MYKWIHLLRDDIVPRIRRKLLIDPTEAGWAAGWPGPPTTEIASPASLYSLIEGLHELGLDDLQHWEWTITAN
jgi:hypothetical protein